MIGNDLAEPLPGMEQRRPGSAAPSALEAATRRTIAELHAQGLISEMHAVHTAAAVELAQIITAKHRSGRMSTVGNDMRALIDLLDRIVPPAEDTGAKSAQQLIEEAAAAWARETAGP